MNREIVQVDDQGRVELPQWAWDLLLRESGVRSKKFRIQKKAVKKLLMKKLWAVIRQENLDG